MSSSWFWTFSKLYKGLSAAGGSVSCTSKPAPEDVGGGWKNMTLYPPKTTHSQSDQEAKSSLASTDIEPRFLNFERNFCVAAPTASSSNKICAGVADLNSDFDIFRLVTWKNQESMPQNKCCVSWLQKHHYPGTCDRLVLQGFNELRLLWRKMKDRQFVVRHPSTGP